MPNEVPTADIAAALPADDEPADAVLDYESRTPRVPTSMWALTLLQHLAQFVLGTLCGWVAIVVSLKFFSSCIMALLVPAIGLVLLAVPRRHALGAGVLCSIAG